MEGSGFPSAADANGGEAVEFVSGAFRHDFLISFLLLPPLLDAVTSVSQRTSMWLLVGLIVLAMTHYQQRKTLTIWATLAASLLPLIREVFVLFSTNTEDGWTLRIMFASQLCFSLLGMGLWSLLHLRRIQRTHPMLVAAMEGVLLSIAPPIALASCYRLALSYGHVFVNMSHWGPFVLCFVASAILWLLRMPKISSFVVISFDQRDPHNIPNYKLVYPREYLAMIHLVFMSLPTLSYIFAHSSAAFYGNRAEHLSYVLPLLALPPFFLLLTTDESSFLWWTKWNEKRRLFARSVVFYTFLTALSIALGYWSLMGPLSNHVVVHGFFGTVGVILEISQLFGAVMAIRTSFYKSVSRWVTILFAIEIAWLHGLMFDLPLLIRVLLVVFAFHIARLLYSHGIEDVIQMAPPIASVYLWYLVKSFWHIEQTLHFVVWGIRMHISLVRFCTLLLGFEIIAITFAVWCIYLLSPQRRAEDPVWLRLHDFALRYRLGITSLLLSLLVPLQLWINIILQQQDHEVPWSVAVSVLSFFLIQKLVLVGEISEDLGGILCVFHAVSVHHELFPLSLIQSIVMGNLVWHVLHLFHVYRLKEVLSLRSGCLSMAAMGIFSVIAPLSPVKTSLVFLGVDVNPRGVIVVLCSFAMTPIIKRFGVYSKRAQNAQSLAVYIGFLWSILGSFASPIHRDAWPHQILWSRPLVGSAGIDYGSIFLFLCATALPLLHLESAVSIIPHRLQASITSFRISGTTFILSWILASRILFSQLLIAHVAFALWGTLMVMTIIFVLKQASHKSIMLSFFASIAPLVACIIAIRSQTPLTPRLSSIQTELASQDVRAVLLVLGLGMIVLTFATRVTTRLQRDNLLCVVGNAWCLAAFGILVIVAVAWIEPTIPSLHTARHTESIIRHMLRFSEAHYQLVIIALSPILLLIREDPLAFRVLALHDEAKYITPILIVGIMLGFRATYDLLLVNGLVPGLQGNYTVQTLPLGTIIVQGWTILVTTAQFGLLIWMILRNARAPKLIVAGFCGVSVLGIISSTMVSVAWMTAVPSLVILAMEATRHHRSNAPPQH